VSVPAESAHPARERLAVVRGGAVQGSAYLLSARLALTAGHVAATYRPGAPIRLSALDGTGEISCVVIWPGVNADIALLIPATDELFTTAPLDPEISLAEPTGLGALPGCQGIGFPRVARDPAGALESEQITGTLKPGSGLVRGERWAFDLDTAPPAARADARSPWAGLSGTALFAGGLLAGVVCGDPVPWRHGRLEAVSSATLLDSATFRSTLGRFGVEVVAVPATPVPLFEQRYRDFIAQRHSTLTIFGLDLREPGASEWPLDTAYLSLEATGPQPERWSGGFGAEHRLPPEPPRPAEQALAGHERVLLRGAAGSGKTTLVQWLAVTTARRRLPAPLAHLSGRVPFVLPLRTVVRHGPLPSPDEFLAATRVPIAGAQPAGWADAVLTAGRGLLLVDGIDEVPEPHREGVRRWLRDLLTAYPGNLWMVTSRPAAVADSWLADRDFAELSLVPMSSADTARFVHRWHDAARVTCRTDEERERLDGYRTALLATLRAQSDLARLATNPLMCGLICALHRDRRGHLPHSRRALYDAALSMMLARRDRERELDVPIDEEPQARLLQRLAYKLIRNGESEMDRSDALSLIDGALPAMPAVAAFGDAERVYRHLLLRSGLLREPAEDSVDFIHRTFQDYLGARAALEERDFSLMVQRAHLDQWEDVIKMAVAQATPADRARLLNGLIKRGDRTQRHRVRLHLLALACLDHAPELDAEVREAITTRTAELIPPRTWGEAAALARVGPLVLGLLPGPEGLADDEAEAVVSAAIMIGGDAAVPLLARYREHPSLAVRNRLAAGWTGSDHAVYRDEVIAGLRGDEIFVEATTAEQIGLLNELPRVTRLRVATADPAATLLKHLTRRDLIHLDLPGLSTAVIATAAEFTGLRSLTLDGPVTDTIDLAPLAGLPLTSLNLWKTPLSRLTGLDRLTRLSALGLMADDTHGLSGVPAGLPLRQLILNGAEGRVSHLGRWPGLLSLAVQHEGLLDDEGWAHIARATQLRSLFLGSWQSAMPRHELPHITDLSVHWSSEEDFGPRCVRAFPNLTALTVFGANRTVDLTPFTALPRLRRLTVHNAAAVLGIAAVPLHVDLTTHPRPRQ
jgi:hypothetical protein